MGQSLNRKPIKRSTKPIKRTPLKRSTKPIRKKSAKQRAKEKRFKGDGIPENQVCELCDRARATDADHIKKRSTHPHLVDDPTNKRYLCRPCHIEVTLNPDWKPQFEE